MIDANKKIKENWLGWYLICLTLPFSTIYVVGHVRPYELVVLLIILPALAGYTSHHYRRLTPLDIAIMIYAAYMLISVVVGVSDLYESARAYRYMVLGPVLIYASIRLLPFSIKVVTRAHVLMAIVVIVQTLIVVAIYIEEGRRPKGVSHELVGTIVKYSLLASYVFMFMYYLRSTVKKKSLWIMVVMMLLVLAAGLVTSASRGVLLPTLVMLLVTTYIWRSVHKRKLLANGIFIGMVFLVFLIAFSPPKFEFDEGELLEDARSIERVISIDGYIMDLTGRIQFWSWIFDESMRHPFFGYGAAAVDIQITDIGKREGHNPHHPHNVLVGAVVISGLLGLLVMLVMFYQMLHLMVRFRSRAGPAEPFEKMLIGWTIVFFITALTNGVQGGIMMILFFVMGLMQQVAIYGQYSSVDKTDDVSSDDSVEKEPLRILKKRDAVSDNILSKRKPN